MEKGKLHNQHGFTLAEVLLSVAILGVLAAIAMPSIFSIQKSMQMVELDSGAEQIALAAQNQMTSMKVSGTWLAALDEYETNEGSDPIAAARELPDSIGSDIYYLTAQQAKDLKIISSLSIDETVYNGDFVIEFRKSTASVSGVFFANGEAGFFSDTQMQGGAKKYYDTMGSPSDRAQEARLKASPLVGYYEGTPAGATNAVALRNPNIWVDGNGMLCVENVNETDHPDWNTSLQVTIETKDRAGKFVLSGMQGNEATYSVGLTEDSAPIDLFNNDGVYKLIARDADAASSANVYQIDLNKLLEKLKAYGNIDLDAQLAAFSPGVGIKITAKVKAENKPSVPATAAAFIEWPKEVPKLAVLVTSVEDTNPNSLATSRGDMEKQFEPVSLLTRKLETPINPPVLEKYSEKFAVGAQIPGDQGSETQTYFGKAVNYGSVDEKVLFEIKPGNVRSYAGRDPVFYYYQIYEIWVNDTLIGSVQGANWQWAAEYNTSDMFLMKIQGELQSIEGSFPVLTEAQPSIYFDPMKLEESKIPVDEKGSYTLYIRSAPAIEDVRGYFNFNVGNTPGIASSRGLDGISATWRHSFLGEFFAPSSVVLWSMQGGVIPGVLDSTSNDICYYYAPTPFAKDKESLEGQPLASSVMWALKATEQTYYGWQYVAYGDFVAVGQDYSAIDPPPVGLPEDKPKRPELGKTENADFAILTTTPYLYYRSITYYESEDRPAYTNPAPQWVPLFGFDATNGTSVTDDSMVFAKEPDPKPADKKDWIFQGWTLDPNGSGTVYKPGEKINTLPLGDIKLYAKYQEPPKASAGLMYIETYTDGSRGYYGYYDGTTFIDTVNSNGYGKFVDSWGYYAVVSRNQELKIVSGQYNIQVASVPEQFILAEKDRDAYKIIPSEFAFMQRYYEIAIAYDKYNSVAYSCNFNFATAVTISSSERENWGTSSYPFVVRSTDHIVGYFPIPQLNTIKQYTTAVCAQTTNIDMKRIGEQGKKSNAVFSGVYDGNEYSINNYKVAAGDWGVETSAGLFPATKNATIRNIFLVDPVSAEQGTPGFNGAFNFGVLIGFAESTNVENCHIAGFSEIDRSILNIATANNSIQNLGIMIGSSKDSKLSNCSVENIALRSLTELSDSSVTLNMGLLVGKAVTTKIVDSTVSRSELFANLAQRASSTVNMGSVLGWCTGKKDYTPNAGDADMAQTIDIKTSAEIKEQNIGAIIGYAESNVPHGQVKLLFKNVIYNGASMSVGQEVGNDWK